MRRAASRVVGVRRSLVGTSSNACGLAAPMRRVRQAQALGALLHFDHGAHQVAFVAPQLQQAAPVRLADRVTGRAHIEQNAAVFEQSGCRMLGQILFNALGELAGGGADSTGLIGCLTSLAARADW